MVVLEGVGDALGDRHRVLADAGLLRDDGERSANGDGRGARARGEARGGRVALTRAERRRHHVGGHLVRVPVTGSNAGAEPYAIRQEANT